MCERGNTKGNERSDFTIESFLSGGKKVVLYEGSEGVNYIEDVERLN